MDGSPSWVVGPGNTLGEPGLPPEYSRNRNQEPPVHFRDVFPSTQRRRDEDSGRHPTFVERKSDPEGKEVGLSPDASGHRQNPPPDPSFWDLSSKHQILDLPLECQ